VRSLTAAVAVTHDGGAWTVRPANGSAVRSHGLILTALPVETRANLLRLTCEPCLAEMAVLAGPSGLTAPGGVWSPGADDIQTGAALLLAQVSSRLASLVAQYQVHRRKYGQPVFQHPAAMSSVSVPGPLVFAGDAFGAGRMEGAALSGLAAAAHVSQPVRGTQ
jgi:hypothetical protein